MFLSQTVTFCSLQNIFAKQRKALRYDWLQQGSQSHGFGILLHILYLT